MRVQLFKSDVLDDWYVIEPYSGTGQPEGTREEWGEILQAMRKREPKAFRRVAVKFNEDGDAWFRSPRNSMDDDAAVIAAAEVDMWIHYASSLLSITSGDYCVPPTELTVTHLVAALSRKCAEAADRGDMQEARRFAGLASTVNRAMEEVQS